MWVLIALAAIPIIEISLFVSLGGEIGVIATLAEIALTGALGVLLMRLEPMRNADQVRAALQQDRSPASPLAHSALRMLGAVLLTLPGFFTDAVGLLLMIAPLRHLILARLVLHVIQGQPGPAPHNDVIEGDYIRHPDPEAQARDARISADRPPHQPQGRSENRD